MSRPMVVIACMTWLLRIVGALTAPTSMALTCRVEEPSTASVGVSLAAQTYNGWFIGSGFEYAFTWLPINGLFLKTEFRYSQYGGNGTSVPLSGIPGVTSAALNSQKATE